MNGKCYICKKPSHWQKDCPDVKKKGEGRSSLIAMEKSVSNGMLSAVVLDVSGH